MGFYFIHSFVVQLTNPGKTRAVGSKVHVGSFSYVFLFLSVFVGKCLSFFNKLLAPKSLYLLSISSPLLCTDSADTRCPQQQMYSVCSYYLAVGQNKRSILSSILSLNVAVSLKNLKYNYSLYSKSVIYALIFNAV